VYDAMVRMAQDFSMRYVLIDGQGNFGSVDGDGAAAIRYTEARLSAIGEEMLTDLDKETVDLVDNFDGSLKEPTVLPAKLPNLLVNGVGGIAVGMATNIPPHNLGEIADAIAYLIDRYASAEDVSLDDLMRFVKGPDFPSGGMILGTEGIRQAYATGKGRLIVRAHAHAEDIGSGRSAIIVTELPYQVNKANLVERIAELVREERVQGIGDLRDESDRTGMRIVIELKRGVEPLPVLDVLLKHTQLQTTFGANMLALVDGEPRYLTLKRALLFYIEHRNQVLVRRTQFELERALARAHILEGLLIALDNLDAVIDTIRRSRTAETARSNLMKGFKLDEVQAQAILDMQLRRLAALEQRRIQEEYREVEERIAYLRGLLASKDKILDLVKADVLELKKNYGDARRTHIAQEAPEKGIRAADLLPNEHMLVSVTRTGQVRRVTVSAMGRSRSAMPGVPGGEKEGLLGLFEANGQDTAFFVTNRGNAYGLPVHQLPDAAQQEGGLALSILVQTDGAEEVVAAFGLSSERKAAEEAGFICMATRQGRVKRLALKDIMNGGRSATKVIGLAEDDTLSGAALTDGSQELVIVTAQGKVLRFQEETVRPQGGPATGMRGISLSAGDQVIGLDVVREGGELLIATAVGYAKRTTLEEYSVQGRGGQGALTVDVSKTSQTGPLVAAAVVLPGEEVILSTRGGALHCVAVKDVPSLPRATWGRIVTRTRRNVVAQVGDDPVAGLVVLHAEPVAKPISSEQPAEGPSETTPAPSRRRTGRATAPRTPRRTRKTE